MKSKSALSEMSTPKSAHAEASDRLPAAADSGQISAMASDSRTTVFLTLRQAAAAIGIDAGQLSKESKRPGFPRREQGLVAEEVIAWRHKNVRRKKFSAPPAATIPIDDQINQLLHDAEHADAGAAFATSLRDHESAARMLAKAQSLWDEAMKLDPKRSSHRWNEGSLRTRPASPAATKPPARSPAISTPETLTPPARQPATSPAENPAASSKYDGADDDLLAVLNSKESSALQQNRAAFQLASRRLARAQRADEVSPNDFEGFKKAAQELRNAESAYIELEKQRRDLIPRHEVRAIVGECAARLVQVLSSLETSLATEVSIWLADKSFVQSSADERSRRVRRFVREKTITARTDEAGTIEKLIDSQHDDDSP